MAQNDDISQLDEMNNFVGENDKFYFSLGCCYRDLTGGKYIIDIKNFLTEVDRKKFIITDDLFSSECLVMYIFEPKEIEFHSYSQDYALKPVSQDIYICNFFEYNTGLNSEGIKKLLNGNGYNIFQDAELSFGEYLYDINVKTEDLKYVDKRPNGKLNFILDSNIFKYKNKDTKILKKEEIYLDELDKELNYCKDSLEYDKTKFKDGGRFDIKIVKSIYEKVEYVEKIVKFELVWNLKDIYDLKIDKNKVKVIKEFQIDATSTLKSVLGEFFKGLNTSLGIDENYCPYYEVFDGKGNKV